MIKYVKVFKVEWRVWVDGVQTDELETRYKVMFKEDRTFNGLPCVKFGSAVTQRGLTPEEIEAMWDADTDYSEHLKMVDVEGSDFGKVVPR